MVQENKQYDRKKENLELAKENKRRRKVRKKEIDELTQSDWQGDGGGRVDLEVG